MTGAAKSVTVSASVAREVLWHLGYYSWGSEPSSAVKSFLVDVARAREPELSELTALRPEHARALLEARRLPGTAGLEWLRSIVEADGRLDQVAAMGEVYAEHRESAMNLNTYLYRRELTPAEREQVTS